MKKFGHELSNGAQLTVPDGSVWQVALTRKGKDIWFHYGWEDFVESYSILAGYFLFFSYEKNSTFHVIIFNLDACEVDYLYVGEESMNDEQNSDPENEKSVEHVEQQSRKRKMEEVAEMDEPKWRRWTNQTVTITSICLSYLRKWEYMLLIDTDGFRQKKAREQSVLPELSSPKTLHSWLSWNSISNLAVMW